jgi:hypothetical protein
MGEEHHAARFTRRSLVACSMSSLPVLASLMSGCRPPLGGIEAAGANPRPRRGRPGHTGPGGTEHRGPRPLLTETVGLLMQFGASRGDRSVFDEQFSRVLHHLRSPCGLLAWRASPDLSDVADSSASIDDLTVVRALLDGASRWDLEAARALAHDIGAAVLEHQVRRGLLVDAASWSGGEVIPSSAVQTAYLAVDVMQRLATRESAWSAVIENCVQLLDALETPQGLYPEEVPLPEGEALASLDAPASVANGILVLYTALQLATIGRGGEATLAFLREEWRHSGLLAGRYRLSDGAPIEGFECVAVYGLAARLAFTLGDRALGEAWVERMLAYQYLDPVVARPQGPLPHRDTTPFDNLQALLALLAANERMSR